MTFTLRPAPFPNQACYQHSPSYCRVCPRSHLWLLSLLHSCSQQLWPASLQTRPILLVHALPSHMDNGFSSGLLPSFIFLNSSLYTATEKTVLKYRSDHVISLLKSFQWLFPGPQNPSLPGLCFLSTSPLWLLSFTLQPLGTTFRALGCTILSHWNIPFVWDALSPSFLSFFSSSPLSLSWLLWKVNLAQRLSS